jgi:DNA-binding NarL/FixJ family response regulator
VRVLLVDDHALFRAGLASLFKAWGVEVAGEASDGDEAIAKARELKPDVIFMDIHMPQRNGLEATRAIKAESPETTIVMLTVSDDEHDLFEAIKSGAEGYLLKNLQEEEFAEMVGRVSQGEPALSPGLARKLLREFAGGRRQERTDDDGGLTERERQVLEHVARGSTNKEIGASLVISENTVNFHMRNILSKLHLRNRAQVVAWAIEHGIDPSVPG